MRNDKEFRKMVEQEVPRPELSPAAVERFEEAYRLLGEQKEPVYRKKGRGWIVSLSAVAAAFVLLFGVNAAFPAFAEELPLIGGIFAQFHGKSGKETPANVNQEVIDRAVKLEPVSQAGPAPAAASDPKQDCPVSISLSEASCDGLVLNLALSLTCEDQELKETARGYFGEDTTTPDEYHPFVFTANGVEMEPATDYTPFFSQSEEDPSLYTCVYSWYVPESLRGAESLEIGCSIPSLRVQVLGSKETGGLVEKTVQTDWKDTFTIAVDSAFQIYSLQAELCEGVRLTEVTLGVSVLDYQVVMPADSDPQSIALPLDGQGSPLKVNARSGKITDNGDGTVTSSVHIGFSEADLSSLTFRIIQWPFEGDDPQVLGSYTLELDQ